MNQITFKRLYSSFYNFQSVNAFKTNNFVVVVVVVVVLFFLLILYKYIFKNMLFYFNVVKTEKN